VDESGIDTDAEEQKLGSFVLVWVFMTKIKQIDLATLEGLISSQRVLSFLASFFMDLLDFLSTQKFFD